MTLRPPSPRTRHAGRRPQSGLGAVTVIVVLVMLTGLAAAITRLSFGQQQSFAADIGMARALGAARAGIQWGLYQALKGSWSGCTGATQTLDLKADTGYLVTVSCSARSPAYNVGQKSDGTSAQTTRVYVIDAVACNGSGASCPDAASATGAHYVERRLQAVAQDWPH